jgi:diadenosine tetraphosphatase ApaH/serine/threonine PP2A family protein phosphatase
MAARVAVLNDIHGNLPALDAVLEEIRHASVDRIVVGGDVLPGPLPGETMARLLGLEIPTHFIYGNGDRAILAQLRAMDPASVTYWGAGPDPAAVPEPYREALRWTARQVSGYQHVLERWPLTARLTIDGLGTVLFCHATPRSETEIFTRKTPEERLVPMFAGVDASVVVCGHTHMQFDRMAGPIRVVNASSVGMPFGRTGADWLLLGPGIEFRHTSYDLEATAARFRATAYPLVEEFAVRYLLSPPSEEEMFAAWSPDDLA